MKFFTKVATPKGLTKAATLPDDGCSGQVVSSNFVRLHRLHTMKATQPVHLRLANGKVAGSMDTMALVKLHIGDHYSEDWMWVTDLLGYDVIIGQPWLETHDPVKSYAKRTITFCSDYCTANCLAHGRGVQVACHRDGRTSISTITPSLKDNIALISAAAALAYGRRDESTLTWVYPEHWEKLEQESDPVEASFMNLFAADCAALTTEDFKKFHDKLTLPKTTKSELYKLVPKQYHDLIDVWDPKEADALPTSKPGVDHEIRLVEGATAPHRKAFGLSRDEMMAVKAYCQEELRKGFIRESTSPYAAPLLVVKKPGGGIRICVDYRQLNALTIKNRNAPPKIRDTLARLNKVRFFSKFDVIAAFNRVLVRKEDQEKTAFITRFGLFEYVVMPFGLCNAPGTFQAFINSVLRDYLDEFCSAYLDDVLVYSETEEEHVQHCRKALTKLRDAGLYLDIRKCEFHVQRVKYLGMILTCEGLQMDPDKIKAIKDWKDLRTIKDVQAFIGFANFYRRFIYKFSLIVRPLIELIRDTPVGQRLNFNDKARAAFERLKDAFTSEIVLAHFDPDLKAIIECDASDWVVSAILSQWHADVLRPVAYFSMKMKAAELNYPIYDKELLAIIKAFEEWRPELAGTEDPVEVFSDHRTLQWFMSTKQLSRRQARWAEFLSEFNFIIKYRPGKQGTKPDSLTRRTGDVPDSVADDRIQQQQQQLLKDHMFEPPPVGVDTATIISPHNDGCHHAIFLADIVNDSLDMNVAEMAHWLYAISEETCSSDATDLVSVALGDEVEEVANDDETDDTVEGAESSNQPFVIDDPFQNPDLLSQRIRDATMTDTVAQEIIACKNSGARRLPVGLTKQGIKLELSSCRYEDGLLYVRDRIYVPDDERLRADIVRHLHETRMGGHSGKHGTYDRLSRWYYWPSCTDTVARYVKNCLTCQRSKPHREGKHGLLNPLPVPDRYWLSISVDFITPLPPSTWNGRTYRHIMVVVDRLSKKKKFIPLESLDVETVVRAFIEHVWREEGYPEEVISDRGSQFTSHFWQRLCYRIGTKPKLSTAFHPETDGQTEATNSALKQYIRAFVHYDQKDWAELLPLAEFHANSTITAATGISPFFATKGYNPRSGLEPATETPALGWKAARDSRAADNLISRIENVRAFLRWSLSWSQAKMEEQANRHRHPAPEYKPGDLVMLDARNIKTRQQNKGLSPKNLGPFTVLESYGGKAYKLDFSQHGDLSQVYPVFHPWLLHPVDGRPLLGQRQDPQGPVDVDDEGETYSVDDILDAKVDRRCKNPVTGKRGVLRYLIKWSGYDQPDWVPYYDVTGCGELLQRFHEKHPGIEMPQLLRNAQLHEERLAFLWLD
jgi:transposase InsO family protein